MILVIIALHIFGGVALLACTAPLGAGIGVTAYLLGMRHAFDADHIAAIDNTTRNLIQANKRALTVGFWFALGHSSVVLTTSLLFAFYMHRFGGALMDNSSAFHRIADLIGPIVSAGFLYLIALLNLLVLRDIWGARRELHGGEVQIARGRRALCGGLLTRFLSPIMSFIQRPWQICLVGMLFGLGFDTTTEVVLLSMANSGRPSQMPWSAIVGLPILFAAGMTLLDAIDGSIMNLVYDSTALSRRRRVHYNFIVTGISVVVAMAVASAQILELFTERAGLQLPDRIWKWFAQLDLTTAGAAIVVVFVATWCIAVIQRRDTRSEPCFMATRDIKPGEELRADYSSYSENP
jgi:nickel/cobalt transporter (NiCoT) family protein